MSGQYTLELYKSTDLIQTFQLTDNAGTAIDITSYAFSLVVKGKRTASADITKTGSIVTAASGTFRFAIVPSDTSSLTYSDGATLFSYIQVTDASAKVSIIEGTVTFKTT